MDVEGRIVMVTGGGSGLGRAAARLFAKQGARVAVVDRDPVAARAVVDEGVGSMAAYGADVADDLSVTRAITDIQQEFGAIHVCINAAGVGTPGLIAKNGKPLPLADFRKVIDVNLIGTFDVMRQVAAAMQGNEPDSNGERGVFVNVSSGAAWQGQRGQAAYSASKAGLIGLMLPVARDLARDGIRVVTVAPGVFDTAMLAGAGESAKAAISATVLNPTRLGDPYEFAALASHIVANQYLNATTISLDGGARG